MLPPPALKARIMAEVEREAALLASAGQPTGRRAEPERDASAAAFGGAIASRCPRWPRWPAWR